MIAAATPTTTNMSIPNEIIGCIIGKGGSKINEIRYAKIALSERQRKGLLNANSISLFHSFDYHQSGNCPELKSK